MNRLPSERPLGQGVSHRYPYVYHSYDQLALAALDKLTPPTYHIGGRPLSISKDPKHWRISRPQSVGRPEVHNAHNRDCYSPPNEDTAAELVLDPELFLSCSNRGKLPLRASNDGGNDATDAGSRSSSGWGLHGTEIINFHPLLARKILYNSGSYICNCCGRKPKKFDTAEELRYASNLDGRFIPYV